MSFYELVHLLQRLNCRADVRYAEQLFDQFDKDGSSVLEFDEFKLVRFFVNIVLQLETDNVVCYAVFFFCLSLFTSC